MGGAPQAVEIFFRGLHVVMVGAWLLFDFIVYWLHFKVKDARAPIEERLERAHVMHGIDATLPVGLVLCFLTGAPPFSAAWLSWKHLMYGLVVVAAIILIPVSGTALRNLEAIKAGAANVDELNAQIRRDMNWGMPFVFGIWILIIAMSLLSVFNVRCPHCQNFIFR
jgi:hypothetical protein